VFCVRNVGECCDRIFKCAFVTTKVVPDQGSIAMEITLDALIRCSRISCGESYTFGVAGMGRVEILASKSKIACLLALERIGSSSADRKV
jgi:hypothetical protein